MQNKVLEMRGISMDFPGVKALNNVDYEAEAGKVHAICGENGAGKSTLMHILAGVYKPTSGDIYIDGEKIEIQNQRHANNLKIAIVYQERSLIGELSVAENIYAGRQPTKGAFTNIDFSRMYKETSLLLKELELDIDPKMPVKWLSAAMQQMVEIAKALSIKPKILILDEPTATITEREVDTLFKLIRKLKKEGIAIIYISHRLVEIFKIADEVTVLKDGVQIATKNVGDIDEKWIVNKMVGRELLFNRIERNASDETILEVRNFCSSKFSNINFKLKKGEILSFAGLAGAGRTEVMRAIFGADPIKHGEVYINGQKTEIKTCMDAIKHKIAYLTEDRKELGLFLEMTVVENIISAKLEMFKKGLRVDNKKASRITEEYKDLLNIVTPSIYQKVLNLSGGNQQKVSIAKWLLTNANILIVDEPTRGIDVGAKAEIYRVLRNLADKGVSIIIVSSDLPEVLSISDRIYIMYQGIITGELQGDKATEDLVMQMASGLLN